LAISRIDWIERCNEPDKHELQITRETCDDLVEESHQLHHFRDDPSRRGVLRLAGLHLADKFAGETMQYLRQCCPRDDTWPEHDIRSCDNAKGRLWLKNGDQCLNRVLNQVN